VVERHNVPGGCASFFQRDGYRFDVGATLASGFGRRGIHRLVNARLGIDVSPESIEPSMIVHLPGKSVVRYGDERWYHERVRAFGIEAEPFWRAQERIAELAWDFSTRFPALPVDVPSATAFARALRVRQLALLPALGRSVASIMPRAASSELRAFVDAQLLITAQSDAGGTDLIYGSTALDLAREGTFHLADGIAMLSVALARAIRRAGSKILYNKSVQHIDVRRGKVRGVVLNDGTIVACERVIAAIPLGDACTMSPELERASRPKLAERPQRWGAFALYCGLPAGVVPDDFATHHQVVTTYDAPLGEGSTAFLSFSGVSDRTRARGGGRALTISTHTDVARWERAERDGRTEALKEAYRARLLLALERVLPGASVRPNLVEIATPHTFARYTGRGRGLVGGLPQTPYRAVLGAQSHRTSIRGLYLAGDNTFPGQSTVGATLGALNASRAAAYLA
jgi:C-3',4' desaturase CrtD